jgi:type IV pilus assembly protein PilM
MGFQLTKNSTPKHKHTVGLDIEAGSIAASELSGDNGSVGRTAITPLPPGAFAEGEIREPEALSSALRTLFSEHKLGRNVRLGVANQSVIVRTLRLPLIEDEEELETAIRFQAHDQIPMPLEQAVLDHRVLRRQAGPEGDRQMDVLVVAARRDMVTSLLGALRSAGLTPLGIDLSAFGMIRALCDEPSGGGENGGMLGATTLYYYLGAASNLVVANGQDCLFTRVSPVGVETIAEAVAEREGLSVDESRDWLLEVGIDEPIDASFGDKRNLAAVVREELEEGVSKLHNELRLSLDYYDAQETALPIERVVVCGLGSTIPGLVERLQTGLGRAIEPRTPAALSQLPVEDAARLTVSYGLALES